MRVLTGCLAAAGGVFALCLMLAATGSQAASRTAVAAAHIPQATAINVGETTLTPFGWVDFCNRYASECSTQPLPAQDIVLSQKAWTLIRRINLLVNTMVQPLSDKEHWNVVDRWDLPTDGYGDCEDYVLMKRKLLMAEGLPRQALLVTIVKDEHGDGHAVLTVKTDRGEFILDNMRDSVKAWADLPYRFVKRQSQTDPNVWEQIGEPTSAPLIVSR